MTNYDRDAMDDYFQYAEIALFYYELESGHMMTLIGKILSALDRKDSEGLTFNFCTLFFSS